MKQCKPKYLLLYSVYSINCWSLDRYICKTPHSYPELATDCWFYFLCDYHFSTRLKVPCHAVLAKKQKFLLAKQKCSWHSEQPRNTPKFM